MWTNRQETQSRKSLMKGKDSSTLSVVSKNCNIVITRHFKFINFCKLYTYFIDFF
jgi:hypothetical protein